MGRYQPFNDLPAAQFQGLVDDIRARGVLLPILVDEDDKTIDGHQRRKAAAEAGVECPKVVVEGLTEDEKHVLALTLNLFRRHLAGVERTKALQQLANLGLSTRRMADLLGVSKSTVHRDLTDVDRPDTITDTLGREQQTTKPKRDVSHVGHVDTPPSNIDADGVIGDTATSGSDQSDSSDAAGPGDDERPASTAPSPTPKVAPEPTPDEKYRDALHGALNAALKLTTQFDDHEHNTAVMSLEKGSRDIYLGGLRSLARWVEAGLAAGEASPHLKAVN